MIRLADQDRSRWDRQLIDEGHDLVRVCLRRNHPGPYQIQAAIAAVHGDAADYADTDWSQIVTLYDQLHMIRPDPVVALNRAVAIAEVDGPDVALAHLDDDEIAERLHDHQPYHATRADLLARTGRVTEAVAAYTRALELTSNPTERRFLETRRRAVEAGPA
jgi:RNA polymerase sigma-70 factor (ECF subfamily)